MVSRLLHKSIMSSAACIYSSRSSVGPKSSGWLQRISASRARAGILRTTGASIYSSSPLACLSMSKAITLSRCAHLLAIFLRRILPTVRRLQLFQPATSRRALRNCGHRESNACCCDSAARRASARHAGSARCAKALAKRASWHRVSSADRSVVSCMEVCAPHVPSLFVHRCMCASVMKRKPKVCRMVATFKGGWKCKERKASCT
ncbi:hypothetical protein F5Y09DRAFT_45577 [Xylaria sp. FL1042]|nr:hypothetical protein F5Y09DRAFT_45577 [Xylaria sp. FL1042]